MNIFIFALYFRRESSSNICSGMNSFTNAIKFTISVSKSEDNPFSVGCKMAKGKSIIIILLLFSNIRTSYNLVSKGIWKIEYTERNFHSKREVDGNWVFSEMAFLMFASDGVSLKFSYIWTKRCIPSCEIYPKYSEMIFSIDRVIQEEGSYV